MASEQDFEGLDASGFDHQGLKWLSVVERPETSLHHISYRFFLSDSWFSPPFMHPRATILSGSEKCSRLASLLFPFTLNSPELPNERYHSMRHATFIAVGLSRWRLGYKTWEYETVRYRILQASRVLKALYSTHDL